MMTFEVFRGMLLTLAVLTCIFLVLFLYYTKKNDQPYDALEDHYDDFEN